MSACVVRQLALVIAICSGRLIQGCSVSTPTTTTSTSTTSTTSTTTTTTTTTATCAFTLGGANVNAIDGSPIGCPNPLVASAVTPNTCTLASTPTGGSIAATCQANPISITSSGATISDQVADGNESLFVFCNTDGTMTVAYSDPDDTPTGQIAIGVTSVVIACG